MRPFDYVLLILILLIIVWSMVIEYFNIKREVELRLRKKISYQNYHKYKKYFEFKINKAYAILSIITIAVSAIVSILILHNVYLNLFLILLLFTSILLGVGLYNQTTSIKFNKDLSKFDGYYNSIATSFQNKEKINNNLLVLKQTGQSISNQIKEKNELCARVILNHNKIEKVDTCLLELRQAVKDQEALLTSFDDKMSSEFDKALSDFLHSNNMNGMTKYLFDPSYSINIEELKNNALNNLENILNSYILTSFLDGRHKDVSSLSYMVEYLFDKQLYKQEYTSRLLTYINKSFNDYRPILDCLFNKRLVNYETLIECNEKGFDWIYCKSITYLLSHKETVDLIIDMINRDNTNLINKFLIFCDKSDSKYLSEALAACSTKNTSSSIVEKYLDFLELDSGFSQLSNRYENIALVLRQYYIQTNDTTSLTNVELIIEQGTFYDNKDVLDKVYNSTLLSIEPIIMKTFNSLLYFSLYGENRFTEFNSKKINELFVEYKKNLNIDGLITLGALLDALIIIHNNDTSVLQTVFANIDSLYNVCDASIYYTNTNRQGNIYAYGKNILNNLLTKDNGMTIIDIINHIEINRLTIQTIKNI